MLLVLTRAGASFRSGRPGSNAWLAVPQIAGMFVLTMIGWLLFRETELSAIGRALTLSPFAGSTIDRQSALYLFLLALVYSLPLWIHSIWVELHRGPDGERRPAPLLSRPWPQLVVQGVACGLGFAAILVFRSRTSLDFIYFQF